MLQIISSHVMVSSNIIPININFVTIYETGSSSSKIIKKFLGKKSLKYPSNVTLVYWYLVYNPVFNVSVVIHCI